MTDKLIKFFLITIDLDDIDEENNIEIKDDDSEYIEDDFEYISNTDTDMDE
jgi:hypothetical protein